METNEKKDSSPVNSAGVPPAAAAGAGQPVKSAPVEAASQPAAAGKPADRPQASAAEAAVVAKTGGTVGSGDFARKAAGSLQSDASWRSKMQQIREELLPELQKTPADFLYAESQVELPETGSGSNRPSATWSPLLSAGATPEVVADASPAPGHWPTDTAGKACLFSAAFLEGLTYSEMLRLVEVLAPYDLGEKGELRVHDWESRAAAADGHRRDLSEALSGCALGRNRNDEGRRVVEFLPPQTAASARRWLLQEHFGFVFSCLDRLITADAALLASPRIRLPLGRLASELAQEDEAYAVEMMRHLFSGVVRLRQESRASEAPRALPVDPVHAAAEFLSYQWACPALQKPILGELGALLLGQQHEVLVWLLSLCVFIPATDRCGLLRKVAASGEPDSRRLAARDLWWRLTEGREGAATYWGGLVEWARETDPAGERSALGRWALRQVRRLLASTVVIGPRQPALFGLLADTADDPEGSPRRKTLELLRELSGSSAITPGQEYASAALLDAFAASDEPFPGKFTLAEAAPLHPVLEWFHGNMSGGCPLSRQATDSPEEQGAELDWIRTEVLGVREGTGLFAPVLLIEFYWRLTLVEGAASNALALALVQGVRAQPAGLARGLKSFLGDSYAAFEAAREAIEALRPQSHKLEDRRRWDAAKRVLYSKTRAIASLRKAMGA